MKNFVFGFILILLGGLFMSCTKTEIVPATPITIVVDDSEDHSNYHISIMIMWDQLNFLQQNI